MCGIAGVADPNGTREADPHLVDAMLRTLAHRGPDDHVVHLARGAVLGTRRLSIIDLAGGRQPLTNEDGSIVAAQNGEIYNYVELREELLKRGHRLRSDGDTETLVHLYEDHGPRLVEHLRGMFAIAIWDAPRARLLLARDRVGKKPLYWRLHEGRLSYGSELKALLADASLDRTLDREALALFLAYQYVPAPRTILAGVHKLPPASVLVWEGGEPKVERYWAPVYEPKEHRTFDEDRDACLAQLRQAVRLRLRSDVPLGCFLSGGVDSSVITALMAEQSAEPVRTFTIGFDPPRLDERGHADAVARHFSTRHTSEVVSLDTLDLLPQLARAYDEPFGDPSAVPTLRVAMLASKELKVVLTGDGGDELFAGYDRYLADARMERWHRPPRSALLGAVTVAERFLGAVAPRSTVRRRARSFARVTLPSAERYEQQMRVMSAATEIALMGNHTSAGAGHLAGQLRDMEPSGRIDRLLRLDTLTYLPEDLLVKMDRATMAVSLEARAPLLDHELIEFAARLPAERKLARDQSKVLLRAVARTLLPAGLADRPKKGFSVPIDAWFRGSLGEHFEAVALAPDAYLRDVVDHVVVETMFRDHAARVADHGHRLWELLSLELWGRTWFRGPAA